MTSHSQSSNKDHLVDLNIDHINKDFCCKELQIWRDRKLLSDAKYIYKKLEYYFSIDSFSIGALCTMACLENTNHIDEQDMEKIFRIVGKSRSEGKKLYEYVAEKNYNGLLLKSAMVYSIIKKFKFPSFSKENLDLLVEGFKPKCQEYSNEEYSKIEINENIILFQRFIRILWLHRNSFENMLEMKTVDIDILKSCVYYIYFYYDFHRKRNLKALNIFRIYYIYQSIIKQFIKALHKIFLNEIDQGILLIPTISASRNCKELDKNLKLEKHIVPIGLKLLPVKEELSSKNSQKRSQSEERSCGEVRKKRKSTETLSDPNRSTSREKSSSTIPDASFANCNSFMQTVNRSNCMTSHNKYIIWHMSKENYISLPTDDSYKNVITLYKVIPIDNFNEIISTVFEIEDGLKKSNSIPIYTPSNKAFAYLEDAFNRIVFNDTIQPEKVDKVNLNDQKIFFLNKFELYLDFDKDHNYLKIGQCLFKADVRKHILDRICECMLKNPKEIMASFRNIIECRELYEITKEKGVDFFKGEIIEIITIDDNNEEKSTRGNKNNFDSGFLDNSDVSDSSIRREKKTNLTHDNNSDTNENPSYHSSTSNGSQKDKPNAKPKTGNGKPCEGNNNTGHSSDSSNESSSSSSSSSSESEDKESNSVKNFKNLVKKAKKIRGKIEKLTLNKAKELLKFEEFETSDHTHITRTTQKNMLRFIIWSGEYGSSGLLDFWTKFSKYVPKNRRVGTLRYRTNFKSSVCKGVKLRELLLDIGIPKYRVLFLKYDMKLQNTKGPVLPVKKKHIKELNEFLKKANTPQ